MTIPIKTPVGIVKMREACAIAATVLDQLKPLVRPGVTTQDLEEAGRDWIARLGARSACFGYQHGGRRYPAPTWLSVNAPVGHGVGISMHEPPEIPNFGKRGTGDRIKAGMTLAIEPMVNAGAYKTKTLSDGWTIVTADGWPSAHFEHTVLTTDRGPEILTLPRAPGAPASSPSA